MVALTKELAEVSRGSDRVGFAITYSSTEGNVEIHERFQRFCAERANNEYLAGIGKLLDYAEFMIAWLNHEERLQSLEKAEFKNVKVEPSAEEKKDEGKKELKTIG